SPCQHAYPAVTIAYTVFHVFHQPKPLTILYTPFFFFFNDPSTTEIYTLSLHDALPICETSTGPAYQPDSRGFGTFPIVTGGVRSDRKSTRLNSSHVSISYAVFCLKKKKRRVMRSLIKM